MVISGKGLYAATSGVDAGPEHATSALLQGRKIANLDLHFKTWF